MAVTDGLGCGGPRFEDIVAIVGENPTTKHDSD